MRFHAGYGCSNAWCPVSSRSVWRLNLPTQKPHELILDGLIAANSLKRSIVIQCIAYIDGPNESSRRIERPPYRSANNAWLSNARHRSTNSLVSEGSDSFHG